MQARLTGLMILAVAGCYGSSSSSGSNGSLRSAPGATTAPSTSGVAPGGSASGSGGSSSGGGSLGTGSGGGTGGGTGGSGSTAPTVGSWQARASMTTPRSYSAAVVTDTGRIFVLGGVDANSAPSVLNEEYDPKADTWTARAPMPYPRWRHGAAFVNGKIYVVGGTLLSIGAIAFGAPDFAEVDVYDPASDSWTTSAPLNPPPPAGLTPYEMRHDLGAVSFGGKLWALSGSAGNPVGPTYDAADLLDPATGKWGPGPTSLEAATSNASAVAGARVFVSDSGHLFYTDSTTATFFTTAPGFFPFPERARAVGMNGRLYVLGGVPGLSSVTTVTSLDATAAVPSNQVFTHAPMLADRGDSAAVAWQGKIYVFGGMRYFPSSNPLAPQGGQAIDSVEVFTP